MIYVLSGGISHKYGFWRVNFPVGSSCTLTNGTRTYKAPSDAVSLGKYTFPIPESGSWTVSCTDGIQTASKDITFSSKYSYAASTLSYADYIFKAGTGAVKAMGNTNGRNQTISIGTDSIVWSWNGVSEYSACAAYTTSKIDLTNYKKLCVRSTMTDVNSSIEQYRAKLGITSSTPDSNASVSVWAAYVALNTNINATLTIDISAISGSYYIVLQGSCANGNVFDIWLE